jgi:3-oxoadipate enol-lactonase
LLAKNYRVLRYDSRGHGQTSAPAGPYTLAELAEDAHGLLMHLGIDKTHWIGISMGGMIGQTFALAHPGVFQTMLLADSTSRRPPPEAAMWAERINMARAQGMQGLVESMLARWFTEDYRARQPEVMARIARGIVDTPVDGFCGSCDAIAKIDVLDRLHEIDCPTLIMVGEHDHGTPPEMSRQMHANIKGSEFLLIKDAAHITSIEQEAVFNQAMMNFLKKHAG